MTDDDSVPVHCGYCGDELPALDADHTCQEQRKVAAFMATGDVEVFRDD